MKANLLSILLLCLFCFAFAAGDKACAKSESAEKYRYEAVPLEDEDGQKETIDMEIIRGALNLRYRTKSVSPAGLDEIDIEMDPAGRGVGRN